LSSGQLEVVRTLVRGDRRIIEEAFVAAAVLRPAKVDREVLVGLGVAQLGRGHGTADRHDVQWIFNVSRRSTGPMTQARSADV
jgi:hypothetical protein